MKTDNKLPPSTVKPRQKFGQRLKDDMIIIKAALAQETQETKEMLEIYKRYTRKQANKKELKLANEQLADLMKGLGLGIFALLPFAPITIPLVIKIGKFVGVEVLPSSFNNLPEKKDTNKPS